MALLFMSVMMNSMCSKIFVLIGPSGVGKSTLLCSLRDKGIQFNKLISHTTRPVRDGEGNGKHYFFISEIDYEKKEQNDEFIMSTKVHGHWYGISKKHIDTILQEGCTLVCSLNTEAAQKIKTLYGKKVVTIFISPPSFEELKKRMNRRDGVMSPSTELRLKNAYNELTQQDAFDYKILNDCLDIAVSDLTKIVSLNLSLQLRVKQDVAALVDNKVLRAMSYNIRMAPVAEDDDTENAWKYRLPKVAMIFNRYTPDIIGLQEMSTSQMDSLKRSVCSSYVFLGRCPTRKPIESGLGIAYNPKKLQPVSELCTVWLNEKQVKADGPAWDGSNYERFIVYAKFKHLVSGKYFWFMTTHFDHLGIKARRESAKIVMDLAENLDAPAVVTGDFNCFPQLGGQELYSLLCTHSKIMKDSGAITQKLFGVSGSWIGWDYDFYKQKEGYAKYDFIFVRDDINVLQHGIIDDRIWDSQFEKELYPSDHRPVLSDLRI